MNQPSDVAQPARRLDERLHRLARRNVNRRHAHLVLSVGHDLCSRVGVLWAQGGQQNLLADTNPAGNRLTDLPRSDDDDDFSDAIPLVGASHVAAPSAIGDHLAHHLGSPFHFASSTVGRHPMGPGVQSCPDRQSAQTVKSPPSGALLEYCDWQM